MKICLSIEGYNPVAMDLKPVEKPPRFRVDRNLVQVHVIDSDLEPANNLSAGVNDPWSVAFFQRNQLGDDMCEAKAKSLCDLLNGLYERGSRK